MTIQAIVPDATFSKPSIFLSADDHDRLSALAHAARNKMPALAAELAEEVGRAHVLANGAQAKHAVRMNSKVEFRDDTTKNVRTVTIVYPHEADISEGRVSVMTPVGTALIGLPAGQSITWETPTGDIRQLTVFSVDEDRGPPPPEAIQNPTDASSLQAVRNGRGDHAGPNSQLQLDRRLDQALQETFPASDPVSIMICRGVETSPQ